VEPLPEDATASIMDSAESDINGWYENGLKLIGQNEVGVVLMAGEESSYIYTHCPRNILNILQVVKEPGWAPVPPRDALTLAFPPRSHFSSFRLRGSVKSKSSGRRKPVTQRLWSLGTL